MTYDQYLNRLAERTYDNTRMLRKTVNQRRNGMEDLYGTMFSAYGDANTPATFYVSLSPNYGYLEMFAFKFVIKPFRTTIQGGTSSAEVVVGETALGIDSANMIIPNPHGHLTLPHTHNVVSGVSFVDTTSDYWRISIGGIDITPYLIEQHYGEWIDGEGIYPNGSLEDLRDDFYDILDVASMMTAEGKIAERETLLAHDFKEVRIVSDAPFGVDAYLYLAYNHMNR